MAYTAREWAIIYQYEQAVEHYQKAVGRRLKELGVEKLPFDDEDTSDLYFELCQLEVSLPDCYD